jgi:hypothetical protein
MVAQPIRIFPHSREEFETDDELRTWLHNGLRLRDGKYYLRSIQPVGLGKNSPGTLVLFRFDKEILGEAVVKEDVVKVERQRGDVEYKGMIKFEASSIRIYRKPIKVEFLEKLTGRDLSVAKTYFKFDDWNIYHKILEEAVKDGFF